MDGADGTGTAGAQRRHARAFGLEIDASFDAPGLPPATGPSVGRRVRADLVSRDELDRDWPATGTVRVLEERFDDDDDEDDGPARTIDVHEQLGYRLYARHFGLARISPTGASVICAPPGIAPWSWQRFLVGRVLPWAAVLRGYEVLHASAVGIAGRAVAFVGATGCGKTSLALRLVAAGARFVTDDVLALETRDGGLRAHPGASVASVRSAERAALADSAWSRLGTVLGHSGKTYLAMPMVQQPLPLHAIYFVGTGDGATIERLPSPDPPLLLSSTFVLGVRTPERLRNQLDVCATIARQIPAFTLRVTPGVDAGQLAQTVSEHLAATGAGR